MSLKSPPEPVTHCPNEDLRGLIGKSKQKATGEAEARSGRKIKGRWDGHAASKHGQTGKPDSKPTIWQQ